MRKEVKFLGKLNYLVLLTKVKNERSQLLMMTMLGKSLQLILQNYQTMHVQELCFEFQKYGRKTRTVTV
jgi:hypothetical protein